MSEKPEAIRLAEWIEEDMSCLGDAEIAAELRRMHAELQIAHNKNNELQEALQQIKPHATQPAEVTDAQIKMLIPCGDAWKYEVGFPEAIQFARAILALRPERVPMTDTQLCEALGIDGSDDWTYQVRDAVEAHHGITAQCANTTKKETP